MSKANLPQKIRYTKTMAILNNLDNEYPLFESESSSGPIKLFSDSCCNGCICTSDKNHDTEFVQDIIDFDQ